MLAALMAGASEESVSVRRENRRRIGEVVVGLFLVLAAAGAGVANVIVSASRPLSPLENAQFQVISLAVGLLGSFVLGRASAEEAARAIVRPHARSAFRRTKSLYKALGRFVKEIESRRAALSRVAANGSVSTDRINLALDSLRIQVIEQVQTANDALDDWRDLVPEDVAEIEVEVEQHQLLELPEPAAAPPNEEPDDA